MINKLVVVDIDGCLIDSIMPEEGKKIWKEKTGNEYPYKGWWSKPESLDLNIFDIKPFPVIEKIVKKEIANQETYVIILTSRMEKLRPQVQAILNANNFHVDKLDMKKDYKNKGQKVLEHIKEFPDLKEVDVYDDMESNIILYQEIRDKISKNIKFKIYKANEGKISIVESNSNLLNIIKEEIKKLF